jgi:hypothetical protein
MSYKETQHDFIVQFHRLREELGREPFAHEFLGSMVGAQQKLRAMFGNWNSFVLQARASRAESDPAPIVEYAKLEKRYKSICQKITQLQAFNVHHLDLPELFKRAGNPASLKMSGMPDTHVKYMDKRAVSSYLKFLEWYQPDVHLIFGDFADCDGISHWESDSLEPRRLVPEMLQARNLLKDLVNSTPRASTRIFLTGNHEDWIRQGMGEMPQLFDGIEKLGVDISVDKLLDLPFYGYQSFPVNDLVKIGNAHFTHGLYTASAHAKRHMSVIKANIYYGHTHDRQVWNETSINGDVEAASQGCLSRLDAKFLRGKPNNWKHGHGAWEFFPDGSYTHYWVPIFHGRSSFAGNIFDGNDLRGIT